MKVNNILETIGNTPHVRINSLYPAEYEVWLKLEKFNPGGSIKDRVALSMVEDAEKRGILRKGSVIIEPTSGNTGIGLAMVGAVKGYRVILVMPESLSVERRRIMAAYGAEFELTPGEKGMKGSIAHALELLNEIEGSWMPFQFDNPANVDIHRHTTAKEIIRDFPEGIGFLVAGVGTGGHISGISEILKQSFPQMRTFAVEPAESPVISGGDPGPHGIQGIGAGFIPENLNRDTIDEVIHVTKEEAFDFARKAAEREGLFVGISSGATLAAVAGKITEIPTGSRILALNYDTGERYLSVDNLFT